MATWLDASLSRRTMLAGGIAAAGGVTVAAAGGQAVNHAAHPAATGEASSETTHPAHGAMMTIGEVDNTRNGFDPTALLTDWNTGDVSVPQLAKPKRPSSLSPRIRGERCPAGQ